MVAPRDWVVGGVHSLHRQVGHQTIRGGAVPMVFTGLEIDTVARANDLDRTAPAPTTADAFGDIDRLAIGVGVPGGAGTGGEVHQGAREPGMISCRSDCVDIDVACEPVRRAFACSERTSRDLHISTSCIRRSSIISLKSDS